MATNISKIFVIIGIMLIPICIAERKVVCYYQSWASYSGVQPEDFDANLCTHMNYAFVGVAIDGSIIPNDRQLDITQKLFQRVSDMKKINKNLKVLLSVGGASDVQNHNFAAMAADPKKRKNFITSGSELLQKYNMDGLDIDWEVPKGQDKQNYISLLKEIKENFKSKGWLLSAAVAALAGEGYDIPQMNQYLDYVNLMTYDFFGPWSQHTGFNSPLYASPLDSDYEKNNLNVDASFKLWLKGGISANKLIVGIGFYGHSFTLTDPNKHGVHAPVSGGGKDGGAAAYKAICTNYKSWTRVWDDDQKVPYKYNGNQWIGYDDEQSIGQKVEYIKQKNAGGAMIWAIDQDDVKGSCGTKQALLRKLQGVKS